MSTLLEKSRNELISQSKRGEREKGDGKTRYEKRLKSKISSSNRSYNRIDMNTLFKEGILTVGIEVKGETDNYIVKISYGSFIDTLRELMRNNNEELNLRVIIKTLTVAFNRGDVYLHCSCLHPDTKIKLLDGTCPTVLEMQERFTSGEKLYVYSVDENGDFKPGEVEKVWQTSYASKLVKITLDNGKSIVTTPDHLYLNRFGEYVQAEDLKINDSLMPLYFGKTKNDYDTIKLNSTGNYHSVYKLVAQYFKIKEINEALTRVKETDNMSYDVAIHHKDFNKHNNNPDNLEPMTAREHWEYHAKLSGKDRVITEKMWESSRQNAVKRNANPTLKMLESREAWQENGRLRNQNSDRKEQQSALMKATMTKYYSNLSNEDKIIKSQKQSTLTKSSWDKGCFDTEAFKIASIERGKLLHTPEIEALSKIGVNKYWDNLSDQDRKIRLEICKNNLSKAQAKMKGVSFTDEHKEKIRQARLNESEEQKAEHTKKILLTKIRKNLVYLIDNNIELTEENYSKYRLNGSPKLTKLFKDINEAISYFELNHKITDIEYINDVNIPVYDIKVKDYENFLVDAGVILHNCPDFKYRFNYWATVDKYSNGEPELRPANETNPDNKLGAACKHVLLVLGNSSWIIKVASVIINYVKYIEKSQPRLYQRIIYPAIYGKRYEEPVQTSLFDTEEDELGTEQQDIDVANKAAIERSRFQKDNKQGIRYAPRQQLQGQEEIEIEDEEEFND